MKALAELLHANPFYGFLVVVLAFSAVLFRKVDSVQEARLASMEAMRREYAAEIAKGRLAYDSKLEKIREEANDARAEQIKSIKDTGHAMEKLAEELAAQRREQRPMLANIERVLRARDGA